MRKVTLLPIIYLFLVRIPSGDLSMISYLCLDSALLILGSMVILYGLLVCFLSAVRKLLTRIATANRQLGEAYKKAKVHWETIRQMYFFQFGYFCFYLATYMYIAIIRILFIICFLKSSLSCKVIITNKANLLLIPLKFQNLEIIIKKCPEIFLHNFHYFATSHSPTLHSGLLLVAEK